MARFFASQMQQLVCRSVVASSSSLNTTTTSSSCCCCPSRQLYTKPPPASHYSDDSESPPPTSNKAQEYESRHSSALCGFNTHDGPVPTQTSRRRAAAEAESKQQRSRDDENQSLIDPFYTPRQPDQTHLIKGGTPFDHNVGPSYRLADYGESSVYTLILLRHGESEWNAKNLYTGWVDVNLTKRGENEARSAGRLLAENGIEIDHAFTSVLKRASMTMDKCLEVCGQ